MPNMMYALSNLTHIFIQKQLLLFLLLAKTSRYHLNGKILGGFHALLIEHVIHELS